jgi:hypothetical protein
MKIECTQGSSGIWSWRFKSDTGNTTIAEGTKTFESKAAAQKAIVQFADALGVKAKDVTYVPLNPEEEEEK